MKILLLAGEESGVLYANELKARLKDCEIRGYDTEGFQIGDLAVMGVGPILKKLFYFIRVKRTMERVLLEWKPDVLCTIDYPGMNLKLAAFAKAHGIRTVHVVCPQVWAWKQGRIPKIEATIDRLCCFFPFEPALFKSGCATFVGHPLVGAFEKLPKREPKEGRAKLLAVLPGSRLDEIHFILPILLEAVKPFNCTIRIPAANERAYAAIVKLTGPDCVQRGGARELLLKADCAVVASGTATLEAALARCPTILVYKIGWFFEIICRIVITGVKHIGLANVIAEKANRPCPMPEFLQENFTVENVRNALRPLIEDASARAAATKALDETMSLLTGEGDPMGQIVQILKETRQ